MVLTTKQKNDLAKAIEGIVPGSVTHANDPEEFEHLIELTPEQFIVVATALSGVFYGRANTS